MNTEQTSKNIFTLIQTIYTKCFVPAIFLSSDKNCCRKLTEKMLLSNWQKRSAIAKFTKMEGYVTNQFAILLERNSQNNYGEKLQ